MRLAFPLFALVALALGLPAAATHCPQPMPPQGPLGVVTIGPGTAGSTSYYVVDRDAVFGDGIWLYEETNLEDDVQTGGCSDLVPGDCDKWYGGSMCPPAGWVSDRLIL